MANQILRAKVRAALRKMDDPDGLVVPVIREAFDVWGMDKDGKRYFDPNRYPDLMRK